jgi:hypothetical protein
VTGIGRLLTVEQSARLATMGPIDRERLIESIVAEMRAKLKREARRTSGLRGRR